MFRIATLAAGLLTVSVAYAQTTIGPPIAYVKGSAKGDAIYLINPDGTGETKVYQAPRNGRLAGQIERVSVRPGGGELAFTLNHAQLMVQNFDSAGQPVGSAYEVAVPGTCGIADADYRSDGALYVVDDCLAVWTVAPDANVTSSSFAGGNWGAIAALGTSLLYVEHGSSSGNNGGINGTLNLRTSGGTVSQIASLTYTMPLYVDAVGNQGTVSQASSFQTVDLSTGATNAGCTTGGMVKYSPDGSQMIYEFRNMLFVHNADCSGAPFRLARGAKHAAWRSN